MSEGLCWCGAVEWFVGTGMCRDHLVLHEQEPEHAPEMHDHAVDQPEGE